MQNEPTVKRGRKCKAERWRVNLVRLHHGKREHFFSVTVQGSSGDLMRALQELRDRKENDDHAESDL